MASVVNVKQERFGEAGAKPVFKYTLSNGRITAEILNYGATIRSLLVPDSSGQLSDVVLGFDELSSYVSGPPSNPFFGCAIGRVANRVSNARFALEGETFNLDKNNLQNSLHGGLKGLDKVVWDARVVEGANAVAMGYCSPHGENGFPGDLVVNCTYTISDADELVIAMKAMTTRPTPVNLTNHTYFNLAGHDSGSDAMLEHEVLIAADRYLPVNSCLVPTGEIADVKDTVFDFTKPTKLGPRMAQVPGGTGFDHNFCVLGSGMRLASAFHHPRTGRTVHCYTDQPGVQFYTGNFLASHGSPIRGKSGVLYRKHSAFCMETQNYPDAVNRPDFPDSILRPGNVYQQNTVYKFSTGTIQ